MPIQAMLEYSLNIAGSEWIIIIFVGLFALLGTNKLPEVTKKLGRAMSEYNKTKTELQNQLAGVTSATPNITAPVQNERQKMEFMAKTLGIDFEGKTDEELQKLISSKMSGPSTKDN
jgi:sec-independent protein translocase protein TatA